MPQSPSFSSPENQPDNNSSVAAAAAAMTEADPKQAITSAGATPNAGSSSSFFSRRFKKSDRKSAVTASTPSPSPTAFDNAPDFFKQAAAQNSDYITIGEQPKGDKKRFALIVGGVVAAVLVIVAVVLGPKLINSIQTANSDKGLIPSLNKFAHYVLDGSDSTDNIPDTIKTDSVTAYKIHYMSESENADEKKAYFEKLETLFKDLSSNLTHSDKVKKSGLDASKVVASLDEEIVFMRDIESIDAKTEFDVIEYYKNNGSDKTKEYISKVISDAGYKDNKQVSDYLAVKQGNYESIVSLLDENTENQCIELEDVSSIMRCYSNRSSSAYDEIMQLKTDRKSAVSSRATSVGNMAIADIINISQKVYGSNK